MNRKQIIASSLGALAATGLAVYLIRRRRRARVNEGGSPEVAPLHQKNRSKAFSRAKAAPMYEPDDHPE
ncbi:MAG TPA: hypothetical protein VEB63_03915 [Chitinophagaceae bacterium]|nr:hypothetical protein [Chitinophagaceae bacterium]